MQQDGNISSLTVKYQELLQNGQYEASRNHQELLNQLESKTHLLQQHHDEIKRLESVELILSQSLETQKQSHCAQVAEHHIEVSKWAEKVKVIEMVRSHNLSDGVPRIVTSTIFYRLDIVRD